MTLDDIQRLRDMLGKWDDGTHVLEFMHAMPALLNLAEAGLVMRETINEEVKNKGAFCSHGSECGEWHGLCKDVISNALVAFDKAVSE